MNNAITCRGVRGATTTTDDSAEAIIGATRELLAALVEANHIAPEEVASVIFSASPDLTAAYPAVAAREMGWTNVPLLCMQEMDVSGALRRAVRVLIHWNTASQPHEIRHIYLHGATSLRPDVVARGAELTDQRVTVVGLGLIGGSLATALHGQAARVTGVDPDPRAVEMAVERGIVDGATTDLEAGVRDASIVVLAAPVRAIIGLIETVGPLLPEGCLLVDVGSSKSAICAAMRNLPGHVMAVGGHPMAGKETPGLKAADGNLFVDRPFVLCPVRHGIPDLAEALVRAVGAFPVPLDAARHDRLTAAISHVPYMLSVSLVRMVAQVGLTDPWVWTLAASGFGDTSRVAASDVTMMQDTLETNRRAVLELARQVRGALDELIDALEQNETAVLSAHLTEARLARLAWIGDRKGGLT
ncbi:MAG: chorismate mutase [Anaerolineae bacterium]|nr:chorismate mutase [Anaerolineae bacterium]